MPKGVLSGRVRGGFCFERDEKGVKGEKKREGTKDYNPTTEWESAAGTNPPRRGDSGEPAVTLQQHCFQETEI